MSLSGRGRKRKGARNELKILALLESQGYAVTKAGGSLGLFDLIAIGPEEVKCVQVKSNRGAPRKEVEAIKAFKVLKGVTKWICIVMDRKPAVWQQL